MSNHRAWAAINFEDGDQTYESGQEITFGDTPKETERRERLLAVGYITEHDPEEAQSEDGKAQTRTAEKNSRS